MTTKTWFIPFWLATLGSLALGWISLSPAENADKLTVVYPPWWTQQEAIAAAVAAEVPIIGWGLEGYVALVAVGNDPTARRRVQATAWFLASDQLGSLCGASVGVENRS
jgi:hypothetical protein